MTNSENGPDGDEEGTRLSTVMITFVVIVIMFIVANAVVTGMGEQMKELEETCDQKYGDGNWTLVPATPSERDPTFIGSQYVCVEKNSTRALENE